MKKAKACHLSGWLIFYYLTHVAYERVLIERGVRDVVCGLNTITHLIC